MSSSFWWFLGLWHHHSSLPLSSRDFSLCLCLSFSVPFNDTFVGFRVHPEPRSHLEFLTLITSTKSLFQNQVTI